MGDLLRQSIWFGRLVLGAGALLLTKLGRDDVLDPVTVIGRTHATLGLPDAIIVLRMQGIVSIGIAVVLAYCLVSERRLFIGLVFATIFVGINALHLIGVVLSGPGPLTLVVFKPEIVLSVLSACALLLERRRSQSLASNP
jgi:hypothetical protein